MNGVMIQNDLITINKNMIFDDSNRDDNNPNGSTFVTLENLPILDAQNIEYLPPDVQNCVEIDSSGVIDISENQVLEIHYQMEHGIVETEYLVNDEALQIQLTRTTDDNHIELEQENIFNSPGSETISESETSMKFESKEEMNNLDDFVILSPRSEKEDNPETDLTSLNWLHNITNIMAVPNLPTPPVSPKPKKKNSSGQEDLTININYYRKNGDKKPPFSYATLICMAMGRNGNKMTLSAIYQWIRENFLYYRKAHPSWQNSIRHNLSLNKCFMKVARTKGEPGKGGFWKLDLERLEESRRSKRRSSLTVRAPRNRLSSSNVTSKPIVKKTKRYRPYHPTGERKHNILSNISICGENDALNSDDDDEEDSSAISDTEKKKEKRNDVVKSVKMEQNRFVPASMPNEGVVIEQVHHPLTEDVLSALFHNMNGWEDSQLEMLDSLLDSL